MAIAILFLLLFKLFFLKKGKKKKGQSLRDLGDPV